jgi:hypothetical protein
MSISVRNTAVSCLGVTGTISVRLNVFGYWTPIRKRQLSVTNHLQLIKGTSINLSLILVGHELDFSGVFTRDDAIRMHTAIDITRQLYAQVGVGVRKLYWQYIPVAEAGGYTVVDSSEATDLTEAYSGDNDGIDVFFVRDVTDAGGWSNTKGSCDKDALCGRTGVVMELAGDDLLTGIVMAHEVGHFLHLKHGNDITNLMGTDTNGDGIGEIDGRSTGITVSQGNTMKSHCSIRPVCP